MWSDSIYNDSRQLEWTGEPPCRIRSRVDDDDPLPGRLMVSSCRLSDVIWPPTIPALSWLCHCVERYLDVLLLVNIVIVVVVYSHADDDAYVYPVGTTHLCR